MDLIEDKTAEDLHKSLLAEISKAKSELRCAQADITKANSRIGFCVLALNELINRGKD